MNFDQTLRRLESVLNMMNTFREHFFRQLVECRDINCRWHDGLESPTISIYCRLS
jgi:hypothetical protein